MVDLLRRRHLRDDAASASSSTASGSRPHRRPALPDLRLADALPLEDDSVDLAITSAVFLHMGKSFVGARGREIARTLRPGGDFVFDVSFPNAHNPTSFLPRLKPERLRGPALHEVLDAGRGRGAAASSPAWRRRRAASGSSRATARSLPKRVGPVPRAADADANGAVATRTRSASTTCWPRRTSPTATGLPREGARHRRRRLPRLAPRRAARGATATRSFAARRRDYDLTTMDAPARLFDDARPELVFHLAAEVGGIGANRANPGRYWYANLMMGAHVLEQSPAARGREARGRRHRLRLSRSSRRCRSSEDELWNGYPGGDERALRRRQEGGARRARRPTASSTGSNASILLPANLYGPRDNFDLETLARDPGADPEDARGAERARSCSGATARRPASSSTSTTASKGWCSRPSATTAREPVNLGTGDEISIRELAELVADVTGFEGEIVWDTSMPNGQPRRGLDASRARRSSSASQATTPLRDGLERTVAWYRARRTAHAGA